MTSRQATSEIIFQRDGGFLVTPGTGRPEIAAVARSCAQLEAIIAGSYLFKISPIAIWGSVARGLSVSTIIDSLNRYSGSDIPVSAAATILSIADRYGSIWFDWRDPASPSLNARDPTVLSSIGLEPGVAVNDPAERARLRSSLLDAGWPVIDRGDPKSASDLSITWTPSVELRPYQREALDAFERGRTGLVLLPCGAGKTIVGVGATVGSGSSTLVLTPSRDVATQWREAYLRYTTIDGADVCIVRGGDRFAPVSITTYQAISSGAAGAQAAARSWGLIVFDEVQSLPADVFRNASAISAHRRLGLSATLVREDGREADVFGMVGPVLYDVPWIELERDGWIANARCIEVRIPKAPSAADRTRYKLAVVERLLSQHPDRQTLIVGSRIPLLESVAGRLDLPLLTGADDEATRQNVFSAFRDRRVRTIAISRIGSVGLDLPDAEVMIQISGNYGSRQEEAQRLGRLLRPKYGGRPVHFYSLVAEGTEEVDYSRRRQRFLVEQGYEYEYIDAASLPRVER